MTLEQQVEAAGWVDRIVADATIRVLAGEVKRLRRLLSDALIRNAANTRDALRIHYKASARQAALEIENAVLRDFIACQPMSITLDKRTAERDEALAVRDAALAEVARLREELAKATDAAQAQEALIAQIMRDGL